MPNFRSKTRRMNMKTQRIFKLTLWEKTKNSFLSLELLPRECIKWYYHTKDCKYILSLEHFMYYLGVCEPQFGNQCSKVLGISCTTNATYSKYVQHALCMIHADSQNAMNCVMYLSLNQLFNILYGADFHFPRLLVYVLLRTLCHRFPNNPLRLTHLSCALFGTQRELWEIIARGP